MSGDSFNIFDLLSEAKRAQDQALTLPTEVRLSLSPENLTRLKLLTAANVVALADAAAKNPERWKVYKLHFHFPGWTQKRIADFMGITPNKVNMYLNNPACDPEEYWETLPVERTKDPVLYSTWEEVPGVDKNNFNNEEK